MAELEMRAGIVHQPTSKAARLVAYMNALKAADHSERFYHNSLNIDALACAKELLSWRDSAMLYGWGLIEGETSIGRLADLKEVEQRLQNFPLCIAERVVRLFNHCEPICRAVSNISIRGGASSWPKLFQMLFAKINDFRFEYANQKGERPDTKECNSLIVIVRYDTDWVFNHWPYFDADTDTCKRWSEGNDQYRYRRNDGVDEYVRKPKAMAPSDSGLGLLQQILLSAPTDKKSISFDPDDKSLSFYSCSSHQVAARYLCAEIERFDDHLVVASDKQQVLNNALSSYFREEPGLGESSVWRAPQQLLPSLIAVCWAPPLAESVMAYLTLPAGPHRKLRLNLAKHFSDLPGHNDALWQEIIDSYVAGYAEQYPDTDTALLQQKVTAWLPVAIAESREEISCGTIAELCDQVSRYWHGLLANTKEQELASLYSAALASVQAVNEALNSWSNTTISRIQLDRILDIAADETSVSFHYPREVTQANIIEQPECIDLCDGEIEALIYWGVKLQEDFNIPPLTKDELSGLPLAPDASTRIEIRQCLS